MDVFEKLNKTFASWYESLFGDAESDIRPKDVLRKIIQTMEDNRKEGLDNRIYVPNKYVLQIRFENDEERDYLLAFLDKVELEAALRKYMSQNRYHIRGPLDFTIEEASALEEDEKKDKLNVSCRFDVQQVEEDAPEPSDYVVPGLAESSPEMDEEDYTVAGTDIYDASTVAPPSLLIKHVGGNTEKFIISKPKIVIGRSSRLGNDLVIEKDGMVSKRHAEISISDGGFSIKDLNSTNGVYLNGEKVDQSPLRNGDVILLGGTEMIFEEQESGIHPPSVPSEGDIIRAMVLIDRGGREEEFRLPSECVIGKGIASDIRLQHPSVASRHARIFSSGGNFYLENLIGGTSVLVNGEAVSSSSPAKLRSGDRINIGEVNLRFEMD